MWPKSEKPQDGPPSDKSVREVEDQFHALREGIGGETRDAVGGQASTADVALVPESQHPNIHDKDDIR